jgi:hypothetical protein
MARFRVANPDPDPFESALILEAEYGCREKLDTDPHWNQNSGALEAQNGAVKGRGGLEAQNRAL